MRHHRPVILKLTFVITTVLCQIPATLTAQESIFDRQVHVSDTVAPVPLVPRYEAEIGLCGRYELAGQINMWVEETGQGEPLLLIAGGPGTSHHYFHPYMQPAAEFAHLIYCDLRGVGLSDRIPEDGYTIMQAVNDLETLRVKLGYEQWTVLGLSFGGVIAQLYAITYPESLSGMILLSSALPTSIDIGIGSRQRDYMTEEEQARVSSIYSIAGERVAPVHSDQVSPQLQQQMIFNAFINGDWKRRHMFKPSLEDIAQFVRYEFVQDKNYYRSMLNDYFSYDLLDMFKTCPIPTAVFEGKYDLAYSAEKSGIMFEQFPLASHIYFENAGHVPFEDVPEEFMTELRNFIQSIQSVPQSALDQWKKEIAGRALRN